MYRLCHDRPYANKVQKKDYFAPFGLDWQTQMRGEEGKLVASS